MCRISNCVSWRKFYVASEAMPCVKIHNRESCGSCVRYAAQAVTRSVSDERSRPNTRSVRGL